MQSQCLVDSLKLSSRHLAFSSAGQRPRAQSQLQHCYVPIIVQAAKAHCQQQYGCSPNSCQGLAFSALECLAANQ